MTSASPENAPCCPDGAAADLSAAAIASVATPRYISLPAFDCMRYSVNNDGTLICLRRGPVTGM